MRDYAVVRPAFWAGETCKQFRGDTDALVVIQYLMHCPHSNMLGLYYLPVAYIVHDTGIAFEGASKALQRAVAAGFALYDEASEQVWVVNAGREQVAPELSPRDNRWKGVLKELEKYRKHPFYRQFLERYREPFNLPSSLFDGKPLRSPSGAPSKPGSGSGSGSGSGTPPNPLAGAEGLDRVRTNGTEPVAELEPGEPDPEPRELTGLSGAHYAEFDFALGAAATAAEMGLAPSLSPSVRRAVADRVAQFAAKKRLTWPDACREYLSGALRAAKATRLLPVTVLQSYDPLDASGGLPEPLPRKGRGAVERAPGTTHADFASARPVEEQLAALRGAGRAP